MTEEAMEKLKEKIKKFNKDILDELIVKRKSIMGTHPIDPQAVVTWLELEKDRIK